MPKGGHRDGAGRKPSGNVKKVLCARVSEATYDVLKDSAESNGQSLGSVIDFLVRDYEKMVGQMRFDDYLEKEVMGQR